MDWGAISVWTLTCVLLIAGLLGTVVPFLPGPLLIFIGCLLHVLLRPQSGMGWWGVAGEAVLMLIAYAVDFLSGAVGSKWAGGSRWGVAGVVIGGIVGLFFGFIGITVGPLVGGFIFELIFAGKTLAHAAKSTLGTATGMGVGLLTRLIISGVMIAWFLYETLVP
jgi:uncharacterized protein YqgC (DUF456 family)